MSPSPFAKTQNQLGSRSKDKCIITRDFNDYFVRHNVSKRHSRVNYYVYNYSPIIMKLAGRKTGMIHPASPAVRPPWFGLGNLI